jgi:hypothetical protein
MFKRMKRVALIWDSPLLFARLFSDSGYQCDEVTPHLLAAPFFRGKFSLIVVPGGFGDLKYSRVLPALKALAPRFKRYVSNGGVLLLFGAASEDQAVYQWLTSGITYHFGFFDAEIIPAISESTCIPPLLPVEFSDVEKDDTQSNVFSFDGYLACDESSVPYPFQVLATAVHPDTCVEVPVFIRIQKEEGVIFISTIHEYPTAAFLAQITHGGSDTPF